jgi:hypothetical protein
MFALALSVLLVTANQAAPPPTIPRVPPGWVEIDGSVTPDQIPEHATWYSGFDAIAFLVEKGVTTEGPLAALELSAADWKLVVAEATRARERRLTCDERGRRLREGMKDAAIGKIAEVLREVTLECRVRLLESKDLLLTRLTPEGAAALTAWMLSGRLKVKAFMPKEEVEFYRLPR